MHHDRLLPLLHLPRQHVTPQWVKDIEGSMSDGRRIEYPIIADPDRSIAKQWGALGAGVGSEALVAFQSLLAEGLPRGWRGLDLSVPSRSGLLSLTPLCVGAPVLPGQVDPQACWILMRSTLLAAPLRRAACSLWGPTRPSSSPSLCCALWVGLLRSRLRAAWLSVAAWM